MPTTQPVKPQGDDNSENTLYVVLHGLITLLDVGQKGFVAFILDMKDVHKYMLGDWLEEQEIPKRKLGKKPLRASLGKVNPETICQHNTLDPDQNAIVKKTKAPNMAHQKVRAIIDLPRPRNISHFTIGKLDQGALKDDLGELVKPPTHLAGVRIFEYTFPKKPQPPPSLREQGKKLPLWVCPNELATVSNKNIAVLHIYNQPGMRLLPGSHHNKEEFNDSAAFLGAKVALVGATKEANETGPPAGILKGEVECLSGRGPFAIHYLNQVRMGKFFEGNEEGGCGSELCAACDAVVINGVTKTYY